MVNIIELLRRLWCRPLGAKPEPPELPHDTRDVEKFSLIPEEFYKHYPHGGPWWKS